MKSEQLSHARLKEPNEHLMRLAVLTERKVLRLDTILMILLEKLGQRNTKKNTKEIEWFSMNR